MSVHQAAENAPAADRDLAGLAMVTVPEVWPPLAPAPERFTAPGPAPAGAPAPERSWPQQFALLLAETLTGARPVQQIQPLLARRGSVHLHRLLPLLRDSRRPRVLRVLTTRPSRDVIEMTMVVLVGPRARALAVRLERAGNSGGAPAGRPGRLTGPWLCTDIEAG